MNGSSYNSLEEHLRFRFSADGESSERPLLFGVPQGTTFFSMYLAPLGDLIREQGSKYHMYAEDPSCISPLNHLTLVTLI